MTLTQQLKVPASYLRGGTSKGVFFNLADLPDAAQVPGAYRDRLTNLSWQIETKRLRKHLGVDAV